MAKFVVPLVESGPLGSRNPKYVVDLGKPFAVCTLGEVALVSCVDATPEEVSAIGAKADAIAVHDSLLDEGPASMAEFRAKLDALGIGNAWMNGRETHRSIFRVLNGTGQVIQRAEGEAGSAITRADMALTMSQLHPAKASAIENSAKHFKADRSRAQPNVTAGEALIDMGRQFIADHGATLQNL